MINCHKQRSYIGNIMKVLIPTNTKADVVTSWQEQAFTSFATVFDAQEEARSCCQLFIKSTSNIFTDVRV